MTMDKQQHCVGLWAGMIGFAEQSDVPIKKHFLSLSDIEKVLLTSAADIDFSIKIEQKIFLLRLIAQFAYQMYLAWTREVF